MTKWMTGLCVLCTASVASAGAVIEVLPADPGPWAPGSTVLMDFYLTQDTGDYIGLRGYQFDFGNTDPALAPGLGPSFSFDYSAVTNGGLVYNEVPNTPRPATVYTATDYPNGNPKDPFAATPNPWDFSMLVLAPDTPFHVGSINVTLPMEPGEYTLDALNAPAYFGPPLDKNLGAWLSFGFGLVENDHVTDWNPETVDQIAGGIFDFSGRGPGGFTYTSVAGSIVPEPASLALLGLAGLAALRRRRMAQKGRPLTCLSATL